MSMAAASLIFLAKLRFCICSLLGFTLPFCPGSGGRSCTMTNLLLSTSNLYRGDDILNCLSLLLLNETEAKLDPPDSGYLPWLEAL